MDRRKVRAEAVKTNPREKTSAMKASGATRHGFHQLVDYQHIQLRILSCCYQHSCSQARIVIYEVEVKCVRRGKGNPILEILFNQRPGFSRKIEYIIMGT